MKAVGIIPARYASTRFPGKPLALIEGKPMIWWVYNKAKVVRELEAIYVATDDDRIFQTCEQLQIPVLMTFNQHPTAIHRLHEVSQKITADFYVQINGDEPLIDVRAVQAVIPETVLPSGEFGTNVVTPVKSPVELLDPSNIKVVFDNDFNAVYMSRTPIPNPYKTLDFVYYKHVGVIGYNKKMLEFYTLSVPGRLETIEGIDILRFIDYKKQLKIKVVEGIENLSVDTEKDLELIRKKMSVED